MGNRCLELERDLRISPTNVDFSSLTELAECWGYSFKRQKGSHCIYKQEEVGGMPKEYAMMNFQERAGQAKSYQVRQLMKAIDWIQKEASDFTDRVHGNN